MTPSGPFNDWKTPARSGPRRPCGSRSSGASCSGRRRTQRYPEVQVPTLADAHALVIGIAAYRHVPPLPAVRDANEVRATLTDPDRCGYPAANVHALLVEAATGRYIRP